MILHLDGSDINGTGAVLPFGTEVSTWKDKSGEENDATSTTSVKPTSAQSSDEQRGVNLFESTRIRAKGQSSAKNIFIVLQLGDSHEFNTDTRNLLSDENGSMALQFVKDTLKSIGNMIVGVNSGNILPDVKEKLPYFQNHIIQVRITDVNFRWDDFLLNTNYIGTKGLNDATLIEVIAFDHLLDEPDFESVKTYLEDKWQ